MKKLLRLSVIIMLVVTTVTAVCSCGTADEITTDPIISTEGVRETENAAELPTPDVITYVRLRINPEIELIVDGNGDVLAAQAINEDGEVVLSRTELTGMTVAEAGEAFTDKAAELGYIDVDGSGATVFIEANGEDDEACEKIRKDLTDKINKYFENHGIYGKASLETLEKYAAEAKEWCVSVGNARMIARILELYPEMTAEEVLSYTVPERMALIRDAVTNGIISPSLRDKMKTDVNALKDEYAALFELKKEITVIREKLADTTISEDERAALEAELGAKVAQYDAACSEYKEKLNTIKDEYKKLTNDNNQEILKKANEKLKENLEKIKKHEKEFKIDLDDICNKIRKWRDYLTETVPADTADNDTAADIPQPDAAEQ